MADKLFAQLKRALRKRERAELAMNLAQAEIVWCLNQLTRRRREEVARADSEGPSQAAPS